MRPGFRPIAAPVAIPVALWIATLLLAGCATHPPTGVTLAEAPPTLASSWQKHQAKISAITAFTLDARVAASGSFGVTGSLHWVEAGNRFRVHFSGPFGAGAVDIVGDPFVVRISSGKKRYITGSPEQFLLKHFGWTLPLRGLRYWALGLPAPATSGTPPASLSLNRAGQLRSLQQAGWIIDYASYQSAGPNDAYTVPRKFTMHGQKTSGSSTEFRVVVDGWRGLRSNS